MPEQTDMAKRAALFRLLEIDLANALTTYAGHTDAGSRRDTEAWRSAPLPDLMRSVMTHLRAGLAPAMSDEAVEAGVWWVRNHACPACGKHPYASPSIPEGDQT